MRLTSATISFIMAGFLFGGYIGYRILGLTPPPDLLASVGIFLAAGIIFGSVEDKQTNKNK